MWLVYASCAAILFSLRGIAYQWTSKRKVNSHLLLTGAYLTGMLVCLTLTFILDQHWSQASMMGIVMGLFSYIANAAFYKGFKVGKASLIALFSALPPVVVAILAFILFGETLSIGQLSAFLLILLGILIIRLSNTGAIDSFKGIQWALIVMFTFAITDISTKQSTLLGADMFPTIFLMFATGATLFFSTWMISVLRKYTKNKETNINITKIDTFPTEPVHISVTHEKEWSNLRTLLWGMFIGIFNLGGMMFAVPAFSQGLTSLVSIILATNALIVMLYLRFYLKEKFTRSEKIGICCAFLGIIILQLF